MNTVRKSLLIGTTILTATVNAASADTTIIHAGELLAMPGDKPMTDRSIIIEDGRIVAVEKGFKAAGDGDTVIDLSSSFVMPGLMDMHVHLQGERDGARPGQAMKTSDADYAIKSVMYAKRTLMAGFTTVRNVGARSEQIYALRKGVNRGWVDGPRIIASGGVAATGGHGDVDGMRPDLLEKYSSPTLCDGPYDCRRAVRHAIKYGADLIKITATGGVLSDTATGTGQQMTDDELKEIMDTAHSLGRKVAAHAHEADGINAALRAGVDSIEHGSYADDESIRLFKAKGAYLVPTLIAGATVVRIAEDTPHVFSPAIREKALRVGADMQGNFAKAVKGGVKIAFGTDAGVSRHGTNAEEAILMEAGGMSPMAILTSATVHGADLIDMSDTLGTVEPGKFADIIAMDGSPLDDMEELLDVDFVMKGGKVYKNK